MIDILLVTLLAGFATGVGGIFGILYRAGKEGIASLLSLSSGVMFGVTIVGMMPEGLTLTKLAVFGLISGMIVLFLLDVISPHIHTSFERGGMMKTAVLLTIGIAIHDFPEGLAIGVGYVAIPKLGFVLGIAIALHNIPEGLAISVSLRAAGISRGRALLAAFAAGIPTFLGGVAGCTLFQGIPSASLGIGMGFAAGAMFYVASDELIPQAYRTGKEHSVAAFLMLGVAVGGLMILL
jgi:ZIP family zinc transporter